MTGISTALHLTGPYLLVERDAELGGLARTHEREGFWFDRTGHWLHLRDPGIKELVTGLMGDQLALVQRRAQIFFEGRLTRYPFQGNLHGLPPDVAYECLLGFIQTHANRKGAAPKNFEQYILYNFGEGIARHFMIPYNTKLWGVHPREITSAWCERFVPVPSLEQVVAGAVGAHPEELGYNVSFYYPRQGGIESLTRALAAQLDPGSIRLGAALESIDPVQRVAVVGGERVPYNALVSSIALPELVRRLVNPPTEVIEAAGLLRATAVQYLNVATRTPPPADYHWIYVPEPRLPFYRVGVFSNAMASMAPEGGASLYVELASRAPVPLEEIVGALVEVHALRSTEDLVFAEFHEIKTAYVVFDDNYETALGTIFPYLERQMIFSRGRYGSWIYNAMEDSLLQGREVASRVEGLQENGSVNA